MFKLFKKQKPKAPKEMQPGTVAVKQFTPAAENPDLELLKKDLADQEQLIRDIVVLVTWIAEHKRYEHIRDKLIQLHEKLDKLAMRIR